MRTKAFRMKSGKKHSHNILNCMNKLAICGQFSEIKGVGMNFLH